jgi:hypothetical protein
MRAEEEILREANDRLAEIATPLSPLVTPVSTPSSREIERTLDLAKDTNGQWRFDEAATALRLEQELGRTLTRSSRPGADFQDAYRTTWDAIGSGVTDRRFNYDEFTETLRDKLSRNAADRIAVDLTGLGSENAAMVRDYIGALSSSLRNRTRILE